MQQYGVEHNERKKKLIYIPVICYERDCGLHPKIAIATERDKWRRAYTIWQGIENKKVGNKNIKNKDMWKT